MGGEMSEDDPVFGVTLGKFDYPSVTTEWHYSKVFCHLDDEELRKITQAVLSALAGEGWEYKLVRVNKSEGQK